MSGQYYHQVGELIAERYRLLSVLGQGGSGITYAAEDLTTQEQVAVKALSLQGISDWKQLELFEREAQVLSKLDHRAISNYIDYFQTDSGQNRWFYIVQELAPGKSLAALIDDGWHATQADVRQIAVQGLDILQYLHQLSPPIIHRDIKPQNLIRTDEGQIYLVDFGAVQNVCRQSMVGSTVVGTYGYMAPEHFQGKAVPATDLYGLGGTLLFLLTHTSPADLPQERLKINFRSVVNLQSDFADWLDQMLEPAVEDRFASAPEALAHLKQSSSPSQPKSPSRRKGEALRKQPKGSKIQINKTKSHLTVEIPPTGFRGNTLGIGLFALFCEGFAFVIFASVFTSMLKGSIPSVIFLLAGLPLGIAGIGLITTVLFAVAGHIYLDIGPQQFQLLWTLNFCGIRYRKSGPTAALAGVNLTPAYQRNGRSVQSCTLIEGTRTHQFGTRLSLREQEWLVQTICDFLKRQVR